MANLVTVVQLAWRDRIAVDPKVLAGKPIIKGTRLAVEFVLELLANGWAGSGNSGGWFGRFLAPVNWTGSSGRT